MSKYRRKLLIWAVGLILARAFFPYSFLWFGLGSLAYFPLNDFLVQNKRRKLKSAQSKRYLYLLEAANVYFQDAFSIPQFIHKLKSQAPPDDSEWSKTVFFMDQIYRSHGDYMNASSLLQSRLPSEAAFFLHALFGPEAFREQLGEISLVSLRYYRQLLRSDLEVEAGSAAQKSEAQIMLILPIIFSLFLPGSVIRGSASTSIGLLLSSLAWLLALAAFSLFLKLGEIDHSFDSVKIHLQTLFERIPSPKTLEKLFYRLIQLEFAIPLIEAWQVKHSRSRTRVNSRSFEPLLEQKLIQTLNRILFISSVISLILVWQSPISALLVFVFIPLLFYLAILAEAKKISQTIQEAFPEVQHRLYLYLISGYSLSNAWQELIVDLPPGFLNEDFNNLQHLIQGGSSILEALTVWSNNLKITEIQESIALLQRYCESGSRESLLRFGEQMMEESSSQQMRQHIKKSQLQSSLMLPIMLDLISIILICLIPALEAFGHFG